MHCRYGEVKCVSCDVVELRLLCFVPVPTLPTLTTLGRGTTTTFLAYVGETFRSTVDDFSPPDLWWLGGRSNCPLGALVQTDRGQWFGTSVPFSDLPREIP